METMNGKTWGAALTSVFARRRAVRRWPPAEDLGRYTASAEVIILLAYFATYIWILAPLERGAPMWPAFALFFMFTLTSHLARGETLADLGVRFDTLGRSLMESMVLIAPTLLVVFVTGLLFDTTHHLSPKTLALSILAIYPWALFQQYGLLAVFGRRLQRLSHRPFEVDLGCATIFAFLHLPNPLLVSTTFGAGYCLSVLFRRSPNLFAVALAHAVASAAIGHCLPTSITLSMSVGPGCLLKIAAS